MAVLKANAYGHGLIEAAATLDGADGFAVARLQQAPLLRNSGITKRILVCATLLDHADLMLCSEIGIDVVAHELEGVKLIAAQTCREPLRVWLKHDSGMHRAGLSTPEFISSDRLLRNHAAVHELVHMTHFSSAADRNSPATASQLKEFMECHSGCLHASVSVANSAALACYPETRCDWVRPGIMLYGDNPVGEQDQLGLRPVMRLVSYVIALREIDKGDSVGYDRSWAATRRSRIGTVGIGYGDGYPRLARSGTPVWINGHVVPVIGKVSMDSLMVDLTDCAPVRIGDEVVLWGPELPVATVARHANTISYDLLASLQSRVSRRYSEN